MGNRGLNQLTGHVNHITDVTDVRSVITGEHYTRDFPNVDCSRRAWRFPSVNTGAGGAGGSKAESLRDPDPGRRVAAHREPRAEVRRRTTTICRGLGLLNANEHFPTLTFFDDPSVILSNSNGRYPQGFQTPGIVRQWQQANGGSGVTRADSVANAQQLMAWFQDDWRATPRLTLNLGVRYDLDFNFYDQQNYENNATRLVLEAIGNPYGGMPKTPTKDISPRVGFAYDLAGDGRRVLRGGYGLYFDQYQHRRSRSATSVAEQAAAERPGDADEYGDRRRPAGQLPLRHRSAAGAAHRGQRAAARLRRPVDGVRTSRIRASHQMHIGYAHELAANTMVSVDYTHSRGAERSSRTLNINPIVNGAARAGAGLPPRLRRCQRAQRDEHQVVDQRVRGMTR